MAKAFTAWYSQSECPTYNQITAENANKPRTSLLKEIAPVLPMHCPISNKPDTQYAQHRWALKRLLMFFSNRLDLDLNLHGRLAYNIMAMIFGTINIQLLASASSTTQHWKKY